MKICPNCKIELLDKAKFCSGCGADVNHVEIKDTDLELLQRGLSPKIQIFQKIASGSTGGIYLGEQTSLHRKIVVKLLFLQYANDPKMIENFFQEAKTAANLKHNHIIEIIDFGEVEGRPYFMMEYGAQGSLAQELKRLKSENQKISPRQACWYILDILKALEHAESKKIKVHRDIKPENILLRETGQAILSDFGIALLEGQVPQKNQIIGSYPYMSPEQLLCDLAINIQSDIYSCGIMLYEMITGALPFQGKTTEEWIQLHTKKEIPPLKSVLSKEEIDEMPKYFLNLESIQNIIHKSTQKDREKRYKKPREMINDLKTLLKKKDVSLSPENTKNKMIIYFLIATIAFASVGILYLALN